VVLAEPFVQAALDRALASILVPGNQQQWQQAALAYAHARDLYSMHSTGAIAIENIVARQVTQRAASTMGTASE
jgi:hypothetical protein